MTVLVRVGFVPLVDAALLVVARNLGFAEHEGVDLVLQREASWASIRDKLSAGLIDAAHLLAPAAVAAGIGAGPPVEPVIAPVALSLNGNAITLSRAVHDAVVARLDGAAPTPAATAAALKRLVAEREGAGAPPLTFAHVFPFSTHHYQLRAWMTQGGIDPDTDVQLVVTPPPLMVSGMETGALDGFCVGAPWNSLAVIAGLGSIVHLGTEIVPDAPEKVLALSARRDRDDPATTDALVRAIVRASAWAGDPANREQLAVMLAAPEILDVEPSLVGHILAGSLMLSQGGEVRNDAAYVRLDQGVVSPDPAHAEWIVGRMADAGQVLDTAEARSRARSVYRPDRFADAMRRQ